MTSKNLYITISGSPEEKKLRFKAFTESDFSNTDFAIDWPFNPDFNNMVNGWFEDDITSQSTPMSTGNMIYDLIFPDEFKVKIHEIFEECAGDDELFVYLKPDSEPSLNQIPYEILHDGDSYLFSNNRIFVRSIENMSSIRPIINDFHNYLIVLAEPKDCEIWGHDQFVKDIDEYMESTNKNFKILEHATKEMLQSTILQNRGKKEKFDAIFIIAHGNQASTTEDGLLALEDKNGNMDAVPSTFFSTLLSNHQGCFVLLCSCWSGNVNLNNPLASIGYRLVHGGPVGAVIAMQRSVSVDKGLKFVTEFISNIVLGYNIYKSFQNCFLSSIATNEHGVPCLITKPVSNETNSNLISKLHIQSVLSVDKSSKVAFVLPGFKMGLKSPFSIKTLKFILQHFTHQYIYSGITLARTDLRSIKNLVLLFSTVFQVAEFEEKIIIETDNHISKLLDDNTISHFFFLGSKSLLLSKELLEDYSDDFIFEYEKDTWSLIDKRSNNKYIGKNPASFRFANKNYKDYAILEKIIDDKTKKVFFFISGMRDTSTQIAGDYFFSHIDDLAEKFGNGGFQYILEIDPKLIAVPKVIEERRPQKYK